MTPSEYCQNKAAASGSSFYYSFLFLPANKRRAITALYAFCREIDDVTDDVKDPNIIKIKLEWWRIDVHKIFADSPEHLVNRELQQVIKEFNLSEELLLEIISGMQMDVDNTRYSSFDELEHYCYRVAGVVGLLSIEIFGYTNKQTQSYAKYLGNALQLTNIIRDIYEDAQRARIYLPEKELEQFNISATQIYTNNFSAEQDKTNFKELIKLQCERAKEYYQKAYQALPVEDRYKQSTGLIMAAIYEATLNEIIRDDYQVLKHRIKLTPIRKLWIAWRTYRKEKKLFKKLKRKADVL